MNYCGTVYFQNLSHQQNLFYTCLTPKKLVFIDHFLEYLDTTKELKEKFVQILQNILVYLANSSFISCSSENTR